MSDTSIRSCRSTSPGSRASCKPPPGLVRLRSSPSSWDFHDQHQIYHVPGTISLASAGVSSSTAGPSRDSAPPLAAVAGLPSPSRSLPAGGGAWTRRRSIAAGLGRHPRLEQDDCAPSHQRGGAKFTVHGPDHRQRDHLDHRTLLLPKPSTPRTTRMSTMDVWPRRSETAIPGSTPGGTVPRHHRDPSVP